MTSEIVIIGGGVIGLAIAIELKLRGTNVTVLCRDFQAAATHAAAGMLAPDAEKIPDGAMRSLCWRSRTLYADWTRKLEELTGLNTNYWPCGILAPVFKGDAGTRGHGDTEKEDTGTRKHGDTEKLLTASPRLCIPASSYAPVFSSPLRGDTTRN